MEASWNIKHQALHSDSQNLVANYLLRTVPVTAWAAGVVLGRRPMPKQRVNFGAAFWRFWRFWLEKRQKPQTKPRHELKWGFALSIRFSIFLRTLAFARRMASLLGMPCRVERRIKRSKLHRLPSRSIWWNAKPPTYRILVCYSGLFRILLEFII